MPRDSQVRGMLLEEALLYLLRVSGYQTVDRNVVFQDPTLFNGRAGLEVKGRGGRHQIDAIADFRISHPFSHPQRLLVEAKCNRVSSVVGLEIIRNAVGVLKDVGERWVPIDSKKRTDKKRYHYQYAIFSASGYTAEAKMYAFAQDIYLIPLAESRFIQPLIRSIRDFNNDVVKKIFRTKESGYLLKDLRQDVRYHLRSTTEFGQRSLLGKTRIPSEFGQFISEVKRLDGAILATLGGQFPLFLTPNPEQNLWELGDTVSVRFHWDSNSWYISNTEGKKLFSFDLPTELQALYAVDGDLSLNRALDLKSERLQEIQAILTQEERVHVLTMRLDTQWLDEVRNRLNQTQRSGI